MASKRGEVWLVDLGYAAKTRPAVLISVEPLDQERALVSLVPHTTAPRGTQYEVPSSVSFLKAGVFDSQNLVTISTSKLIRRLGTLSEQDFTKVLQAVRNWLDLND